VLCVLAAWLLQHPYAGIAHDSVLYTLLALERLHPAALGTDVFLRFGSQDRYTIFSPLYSQSIALLGMEPAAALLTFVSQLAFFGCAWWVARRFMGRAAATFATALLIIAPGEYGSAAFFHSAETFLTPRLPAEALVLGAIAAALAQRRLIASVCLVGAMLLHPVMGAAGVAFLVLTFLAPHRPRLVLSVAAVLLAGSLAVLLVTAPLGRFDETWLRIIRAGNSYLYASTWSLADWSRVATALSLLPIGLLTGVAPTVRRVCMGALLTAACGLCISLVYCDLLHVMIFTQLQSWRWLWLANTIALLLAPVIAADCWRTGTAGRTAIVLLGGAWLLRGTGAGLCVLTLALACAAAPAAWREHRYMRYAFLGACVLAVAAAANGMLEKFSYVPTNASGEPVLMQQLRLVCADGVIPGIVLMGASLGWVTWKSPAYKVASAATATLACVMLASPGWSSWTRTYFTPALSAQFAQWRATIPPHVEVIWPTTPLGAWYLLERPSYWSFYQNVGAIFSRQKALLVQRRTDLIATAMRATRAPQQATPVESSEVVAAPVDTSQMNTAGLRQACADPDLHFVVSWRRLGSSPVAPVTPDPQKPLSRLYLYSCADFRS
jgi:hypothetical protein